LRAKAGYTSEDFLAISELAENPGQAIILCAPEGRQALEKGLTALGWEVFIAKVYERQDLQPSKQQIDEIISAKQLISVWTSVSALNLAVKYLPSNAWDKILCSPALVISARIKHHLQQKGASRIQLTDGPGNEQLLRSIRQNS
jgi:uroporphyrinogen-III synthase